MVGVVVLGGGFGGLAAADELRRLLPKEHQVTVVARDEWFAMGWTKLWDLLGVRARDEGTRSLWDLEHKHIRFVHADVTRIDPDDRFVETTAGPLTADALLVALGAGDDPGQVSRLGGDDAHNLYDPAALPQMRAALANIDSGRLLVASMGQPFKCPPAPFEAVLGVDGLLRGRGVRDDIDLTIATPAPSALPVAGPEASKAVAAALAERGIALHTEHTLVNVGSKVATFDTGQRMDYEVLFAVPRNVAPAVLADSPLAGEGGWVRPDPRTLATDFDRVYAVGDCTTVPTATAALPKAGVFAAAEARVAARNIVADLTGSDHEQYDGRGSCFLEFPGRQVAVVEGDFFATPAPDVTMHAPSHEAFRAKQDYERDHLSAWLG